LRVCPRGSVEIQTYGQSTQTVLLRHDPDTVPDTVPDTESEIITLVQLIMRERFLGIVSDSTSS
jgi:hypothetical protein